MNGSHGRAILLVLPLASGCLYAENTNLARQRELCHPVYGCQEVPWWTDADGDGFGDPASTVVLAADRPADAANNALDCDDAEPAVTARVQALCPADFLPVIRPEDHRTDRGRESLIGRYPTPALDAHSVCGPVGWGGRLGAPTPDQVWTSEPVWVALEPTDLDASWSELPGYEFLPAGQPVALAEGRLVTGSHTDLRPFFCSREAPDPGDWYTVRP